MTAAPSGFALRCPDCGGGEVGTQAYVERDGRRICLPCCVVRWRRGETSLQAAAYAWLLRDGQDRR